MYGTLHAFSVKPLGNLQKWQLCGAQNRSQACFFEAGDMFARGSVWNYRNYLTLPGVRHGFCRKKGNGAAGED